MGAVETPIRGEFTLTPEDYLGFWRLYRRSVRWKRYLRMVLIVIAAGVAGMGVWLMHWFSEDRQVGLVFVLFACIVLIPSALPIAKWQLRRQFRKRPLLRQPIALAVDEQFIVERTELSVSEYKWPIFARLLESGDLIVLIFVDGTQGVIIPKRALTPPELERFKDLLRRKLPAAQH